MQHAAISRAEKDEWLSELMQTYGDDILRLCYVILQDRTLAEDASQEVFLKAYKRLHTLRQREYCQNVAGFYRRQHLPGSASRVGGCATRTEASLWRICRPPPVNLTSGTTACCAR